MTRENISDAMGFISSDLIEKSETARNTHMAQTVRAVNVKPNSGKKIKQHRLNRLIKRGAVIAVSAACLALIISVGISAQKNGTSDIPNMPPLENNLNINQLEGLTTADMDVQCNMYDQLSKQDLQAVLNQFQEFAGMSYEDFTSKICDIWEISSFYSLSAPDYINAGQKGEYSLHDYVFELDSNNGGTATVALCSFEKPLRDIIIDNDDPKQSVINGVPLVIYGFEAYYMVQFSYDNLYYDIETNDIALKELENLLSSIISD